MLFESPPKQQYQTISDSSALIARHDNSHENGSPDGRQDVLKATLNNYRGATEEDNAPLRAEAQTLLNALVSVKQELVSVELLAVRRRQALRQSVVETCCRVVPQCLGAEKVAHIDQQHERLLTSLRHDVYARSRKMEAIGLVRCDSPEADWYSLLDGLLDDVSDAVALHEDEINERVVVCSAQLNEKRALLEVLRSRKDVLCAEVKQRRRRTALRSSNQRERASLVNHQLHDSLSEVECVAVQFGHDEAQSMAMAELRVQDAADRAACWQDESAHFAAGLPRIAEMAGENKLEVEAPLLEGAPTIEAVRDLVLRDQLCTAAPSIFSNMSRQMVSRSNLLLNQIDFYHRAMDTDERAEEDARRPSEETLACSAQISAKRAALRLRIASENDKFEAVRQRSASRRDPSPHRTELASHRSTSRGRSPRGAPAGMSVDRSSGVDRAQPTSVVIGGPLQSTKQQLMELTVAELLARRQRLTGVFNALFREHQRDLVVAPSGRSPRSH
jgi:hypothetical protein